MGIFTRKKEELKNKNSNTQKEKNKEVANNSVKKNKETELRNFVVAGVLLSPLITEKTSKQETFNKYTFIVKASTNKSEIIKAFVARYGVMPEKVNIANYFGKYKRLGRIWGKTKDWKKAVISLPKGKTINIYEGIK